MGIDTNQREELTVVVRADTLITTVGRFDWWVFHKLG
jgi:hypothetical protein